jgi:NAD+ synthase (glutamine-hydrolysing)
MVIALAQQNYHIGNFEANIKKILGAINEAKNAGAELVVFSELSICGYPPRDYLEFSDFLEKCDAALELVKNNSLGIGVIVGAPAKNTHQSGKDLFNAAWFFDEGKQIGIAYKTLLPTYDVFDEYRYFEPAFEWNVIEFKGNRIALTVCEDIWNLGNNPLYRICPMDQLMPQHPDLMINISASPFDYDHAEDRIEVIRANVLKYKLPMAYCNAVGSQTEIVFDGGSLGMDVNGCIVKEAAYFKEDLLLITLNTQQQVNTSILSSAVQQFDRDMRVSRVNDPNKIVDFLTEEKNIAEIYEALKLGISDYFGKMGFKQAILGSSGGIDSAVTLAIAVDALGAENVRAILMPSQFSTGHSVDDAVELSKNLLNPYDIIPIKGIYEAFEKELQPIFQNLPFGLAEENMQSRSRGNLLMAIANKFGYILLNTSNKSELSTGYGTLYGDMAGGLSVLGDVYKIQVYALARYINRDGIVIPQNIIDKEPSAELRPNQKDSDSLPDYNLLDKVLYQFIERRKGFKEMVSMGIDEALVKRVMRLVNMNEYKRNQFCPIIRVSTKAFGVGRRVPIVSWY